MNTSKAYTSKTEYSELITLGSSRSGVIDKLCASLLALTPLLQHYKGPIVDAGVTVLCLVTVWFTLSLLFLSKKLTLRHDIIVPMLGLCLFNIFKGVIHGLDLMNLIYALVCIFILLEAGLGVINLKQLFKTAEAISLLACGLIVIQYISYYLLGKHICMAPVSLLLPESSQWILVAETGTASITGKIGDLYRPSAFFLEPSHLYLYIFPQVLIELFAPSFTKKRFIKAIVLSMGIMLSTSGMGLVVVAVAWCIFAALNGGKNGRIRFTNLLRPINIIMLIVIVIAAVSAVLFVPFVNNAVARFLDTSSSGAIAGRTRLANELLSKMTGGELIIGVANAPADLGFNMSGYASTLYRLGIIGVILSYSAYVPALLKLKNQYFLIAAVIFATSLYSAHTHGTFFMLYYVFILFDGFYRRRERQVTARDHLK